MHDYIICEICKKQFKRITKTHLAHHGLNSIDEYKKLYPNAQLNCESLLLKYATNSLEVFVKKYGEDVGKVKYEEYKNFQSTKNTFAYKNKKYGWDEAEFLEYNKSRAVTLENMIVKYGEDVGKEKFQKYCELQAKNGKTLEYFIEKLGDDAGKQKYEEVNKKKAITLENMIIRYGEEIGKIKYDAFIEQLSKPLLFRLVKKHGDILGKIKYEEWLITHSTYLKASSKIANEFIQNLLDMLPIEYVQNCKCSLMNNEIYLMEKQSLKTYFYDLCFIDHKIIIEFNGDFWHANPMLYKIDDVLNFPKSKKIIAGDLWNKDEEKRKLAEKSGYNILTVWENAFNKNKTQTILETVTWILSKQK